MIRTVRSLWIYGCILALTFVHGGIVIVSALLGLERAGCICQACSRRWGRQILRLSSTEVTVEGLEHLHPDRAQVLICNHESWYDIFAFATMIPGPFRFLAKKELEGFPVFGRAARACGHVFVDRGDHAAAMESMAVVGERFRREGGTVVILPEGTRTRTGELLPFKKGAFVLAIQARVPIVPAGVAGSRAVLPKGGFQVRPGPIRIVIGEPIDTDGLTMGDRDRLLYLCRQRVTELRARAAAQVASDGGAGGAGANPLTR
ncbi:MAG: 1-acyl-sn-glycerol-3-phosphate acyltransferase [Gemmatimonadetes bacterium]|nr:1-acyl-sn-glycerol-3-phosphate acyltransferase [Gemmatimonadota bacterium]